MAWLRSTTVQLSGLAISFLGWVLACVTTYVPLWKNLGLELNELERWHAGLWQVCVTQDGKTTECKSHNSLLTLPLDIKISRIIMVASNVLGFLAITLSILGSNCMKTRDQNPGLTKQLVVAGGVVACVSGMATLAPVSWTAYNIVQDFWDGTVPQIVPRWDLGDALFLGWFAGFFLILGGFLLICSACSQVTERPKRQLAVHWQLEMQKSSVMPNHHQTPSPKNEYLVI